MARINPKSLHVYFTSVSWSWVGSVFSTYVSDHSYRTDCLYLATENPSECSKVSFAHLCHNELLSNTRSRSSSHETNIFHAAECFGIFLLSKDIWYFSLLPQINSSRLTPITENDIQKSALCTAHNERDLIDGLDVFSPSLKNSVRHRIHKEDKNAKSGIFAAERRDCRSQDHVSHDGVWNWTENSSSVRWCVFCFSKNVELIWSHFGSGTCDIYK